MCSARLQVRRDKSSVEAGSNCRIYVINRRTAKHKKPHQYYYVDKINL